MPISSRTSNRRNDGIALESQSVQTGQGLATARRSLAVWVWTVLLIADAVLVARVCSGQFVVRLPLALAFLSVLVVSLASLLAWFAFRTGTARRGNSQSNLVVPTVVSLIVPTLWSGSLIQHTDPLAIGMLLGVALFQWLLILMVTRSDHQSVESAVHALHGFNGSQIEKYDEILSRLTAIEPTDQNDQAEGLVDHFDPETEADVTQWLSRRATDDGELIEGWVRVGFAADQREVTIHVAFCPPLSGLPEIETEDLDGGDLEIRVGMAMPFGTRLAVRRSGPTALPHTGRIGFVAKLAASQRAA